LSPNEAVELLLASLEGVEKTRMLAVASFALFVYDHILTFDREVEFFWNGKWTMTRILFFANRYFPPVIFSLGLVCLFMPRLSFEFCAATIPAIFLLDTVAITIVQAIIVTRCWYLFQNCRVSRFVIIFSYLGCAVATFIILGFVWHELQPLQMDMGIEWDGCMAPLSKHVYRVFIPGIIIHTLLYGATTLPALRLKSKGKSSPIMNRLMMDGGGMYLVVFVTVMFSGIGAVSTNLNVSLPAMYSNFMLSATSVAVSRLILNMQSLAANLSLDPKWLLNNAELSRVRWRKGSRDGELIVEVDVAEADNTDESASALELGAVTKGLAEGLAGVAGVAGIRVSSETGVTVAQRAPARRANPRLTTTTYGYVEDMPNMFYKGKGDTRP